MPSYRENRASKERAGEGNGAAGAGDIACQRQPEGIVRGKRTRPSNYCEPDGSPSAGLALPNYRASRWQSRVALGFDSVRPESRPPKCRTGRDSQAGEGNRIGMLLIPLRVWLCPIIALRAGSLV